ncbi:MAG: NifU family protein [Acidimicrobiales bacterium]
MARIAEDLAVVTLSPEAREIVREALAQEPDPDRLALWLEVRGVQQAQFVYDLYFQAASDAAPEDAAFADGEISVVVPTSSVDRLRGARLEWNAEGEGGLVLVNPNSPEPEELGVPAEVMAAGIGGPLGSRVAAVLDQAVNPSIAAHGGRADLVAMDESGGIAYLRLSGGCQGCAMSRMTLTQGIEASLREEVRELSRVIDVTDHSGGANPYY